MRTEDHAGYPETPGIAKAVAIADRAETAHAAARAGDAEASPPSEGADDFGAGIEEALRIIRDAHDLLNERVAESRGDLAPIIAVLSKARINLEEIRDEIVCPRCAAYSNDGEGSDGLCGSCADREETERSGRADASFPTVGDSVVMSIDEDVSISVESIPTFQPGLTLGIWTIVDQSGAEHMIEDDGDRWLTVDPSRHEPPDVGFDALFIDDEGRWRGQIIEVEEPVRTTALLYEDSVTAVIAALDLYEGRKDAA